MKALAFTQFNMPIKTSSQSASQGLLAKMQIAGAFAGLAGGMGSGLMGAMLIVAGWLTTSTDVQHWLSTSGSLLLMLTIPLIVLGGFCLDWLEKDKSRPHPRTYRDEDDEM